MFVFFIILFVIGLLLGIFSLFCIFNEEPGGILLTCICVFLCLIGVTGLDIYFV